MFLKRHLQNDLDKVFGMKWTSETFPQKSTFVEYGPAPERRNGEVKYLVQVEWGLLGVHILKFGISLVFGNYRKEWIRCSRDHFFDDLTHNGANKDFVEVMWRHNFIGGMFGLIFMHVIVDVEGIVNVGEGSADSYQQS